MAGDRRLPTGVNGNSRRAAGVVACFLMSLPRISLFPKCYFDQLCAGEMDYLQWLRDAALVALHHDKGAARGGEQGPVALHVVGEAVVEPHVVALDQRAGIDRRELESDDRRGYDAQNPEEGQAGFSYSLTGTPPAEVLYQEIWDGLGFSANRGPMRDLARRLRAGLAGVGSVRVNAANFTPFPNWSNASASTKSASAWCTRAWTPVGWKRRIRSM